MRGILKVGVLAGALGANAAPAAAADGDLAFLIEEFPYGFDECMGRAFDAVNGSGLAVTANSDWWVYGVGDGVSAYVACQGYGNGLSLALMTATAFEGVSAWEPVDRLLDLMEFRAGPRSPAPNDVDNNPGMTWWTEYVEMDVETCRQRGEDAFLGGGLTETDSAYRSFQAEDDDFNALITCVDYGDTTLMNLTVATTGDADNVAAMNALVGYFKDPGTIPETVVADQPDGPAGDDNLTPPGLTERRTASTVCDASAGGGEVNDVRFTLAEPTTIRVLWRGEPGRDSWWIAEKDYGGDLVANIFDGAPLIMPPGADPTNGMVPLPAGTFVLHVACLSGAIGSVSAEILLPPMPTPGGPVLLSSAQDQSDRMFYLTAPQTVTFTDTPPTGSIIDFAGSLLWSSDAGDVEAWSTRDLMPGGYCLHGEWPDGPARSFSVEFVAPPAPSGDPVTLTARTTMGSDGRETTEGVQFTLTQPQVIQVLGADTAWIIDTAGNLWFNIVDGDVQSGSAWVVSTGRDSAPGIDLPGVLLPAGSYHFTVATGIGSASAQVRFVGTADEDFDWPARQTHPCYPSLYNVVQHPHLDADRVLGGILAAIRATWQDRDPEVVSWPAGTEEDGIVLGYDTFAGGIAESDVIEDVWVEVILDPAELELRRAWAEESVDLDGWTRHAVPGTDIVAYLATVESVIYVEAGDTGPMGVRQRFEFVCGELSVSGTAAQLTGHRWDRDEEIGMVRAPEGFEAVVDQRTASVNDQATNLIARFIDELQRRGICT